MKPLLMELALAFLGCAEDGLLSEEEVVARYIAALCSARSECPHPADFCEGRVWEFVYVYDEFQVSSTDMEECEEAIAASECGDLWLVPPECTWPGISFRG